VSAPKKLTAIADLTPDDRNLNVHTERGMGLLAKSLEQFGAGRSIVVDKHGKVIAGNATLEAAADKGFGVRVVPSDGKTLVVVQRTDLELETPEGRGLALADNRVAEVDLAWDPAQLKALMDEGLDASAFFLPDELAAIFASVEPAAGLTDPDEVPEPPAIPVTRPGDLWLLGTHRLLCGDSTVAADVARVMNGERAGLMNTDPPYGVAYTNDERPNPGVANDVLSDEALQSFLMKSFTLAASAALLPNAAWYMWHAHLTQGYFAAAAAAANVVLHRQIIWVKPVLLLGRGQYHWKHEPCFMGWIKGQQPPDYGLGNGERTQTTVWEIGSISSPERKELNHSTPKPVGLFLIPIAKHLKLGERCYEPFAGSGPQFIAAEQRGAICHGIEIEARFADTIVERWEKFTGKQATLEGDGRTFAVIAEERKA
jgi:DNA modification methylase